MSFPDLFLEFIIRLADVLTGGKSHILLPVTVHTTADNVIAFFKKYPLPLQLPHINWTEHRLMLAILAIPAPPLLWNLIGRFEYHTRIPSSLLIKPVIGTYVSGFFIALLSLVRSALFEEAIRHQPTLDVLDNSFVHVVASVLLVFGLSLFLGAYYHLRIVGTYLGDYFGILQPKRITSYPFSIIKNPMYDGSSLIHFSHALL